MLATLEVDAVDTRRPLAKMAIAPQVTPAETKVPFVTRLEQTDIDRIGDLARLRRISPRTLARELLLHALEDAETKAVMQSHRRGTGV